MKPILLTFAGLQSYREPQEIDFTRVCDAGVFGIFGRTGSGKSTILDAMTLALYGKVERASNNTQGILNHAEDRLTVAFTFELGMGAARRQYRVERSYVRAGASKAVDGTSIRTAHCRLVQVDVPGDGAHASVTVMADKERDVTRGVENLLGLTVEDFTRAVVLPQGRFAEFLSLKGTDRRQMLQRLFGLEAYGVRLLERLKGRLADVSLTLATVAAEQQGLGDASQDAIDEVRKRLDEAQTASQTAASELDRVQTAVNEARKVREWQSALQKAAADEAALQERRADVEAAQTELDEAVRAESVRPHLDAFEGAEAELQDAERALTGVGGAVGPQGAIQKCNQARADYKTAQEQLAQAVENRRREEPILQQTQANLRQARQLEREIDALRRQLMIEEDGIREREGRLTGLGVELDQYRGALQSAEKDLMEQKAELTKLHVPPVRRRRVNDALAALRDYKEAVRQRDIVRTMLQGKVTAAERAKLQADVTGTEAESLEQQLRGVEAELNRLAGAPPHQKADLDGEMQWLERVRGTVAHLGRLSNEVRVAEDAVRKAREALQETERSEWAALQRLSEEEARLAQAEANLKDASSALEVARTAHMAGLVARSLHTGEPCPVCGSCDHPAPADSATVDLAVGDHERAHQVALDAVAETKARVEAAEREHSKILISKEVRVNRVAEAEEALGRLGDAFNEGKQQLPEAWRVLGTAELLAAFEQEEEAQRLRRQAFAAWERDVTRLEQEWTRLNRAHADVQTGAAAAQATLDAAHRAVVEAEERLMVVETEFSSIKEALDQVRGDIPVDAIVAESEAIEACDRRVELVQKAIESAELRARQAVQAMRALEEESQALELELRGMKVKRDDAVGRVEQLQLRLGALTSGRGVDELTEETETALGRLAWVEEQARLAEASLRAVLEDAERELYAAQTRLDAAGRSFRAARTRFLTALVEAGFTADHLEALRVRVRNAVRSAVERQRLHERVESYRKQKDALATERRRLEGLLDQQSMPDAEWEELQEQLLQAKQAHEAAVAEWGAAQSRLADLQQKHEAWQQLEGRRQELVQMESRLSHLQTLLRGNAFVEFVAEEQLTSVAHDASARLGALTRYRYALEVDSSGGFVIRDDANGGVRRPVGTLSGGETFLTSLALALALSSQIQLRGEHPLEFFFLDEGFGTLDPELLEVVMNALEQLRLERLNIGVISHVPELRHRLARRILVHPAEPGGPGSRVEIEVA